MSDSSERRVKGKVKVKVSGAGRVQMGWLVPLGVVAAVLMGMVFIGIRLFEWERPVVKLEAEVTHLGQKSNVVFTVSDQGSGLREVKAVIRQGKKEAVVAERQLSRTSVLSRGVPSLQESIEVDTEALGLSDGPAELLISVRDLSWWQWARGNLTQEVIATEFDTKPPRIRVVGLPNGIKPGGSGVIVYGANEAIYDHGVIIDGITHRGFPVPTRKDGVFAAFIALPYDAESIKEAKVFAKDGAGNQASQPLALRYRSVRKSEGNIAISDGFLNTKLPEFAEHYPEMKGTPIEQYIFVNNEVRKRNGDKIKELCRQTDSERHWEGKFLRMESAPMAGYADYRTYTYQGKQIDSQVHLGVDLADHQQSDVLAANNGKVVFADYLGIYGNMIMIDHGQGLFSLYGHLSDMRSKAGDIVKTGDLIGLTGTSGMAGGDHLHFSILINGVFVTPVEWWDDHWIKDNILLFIEDNKAASAQ